LTYFFIANLLFRASHTLACYLLLFFLVLGPLTSDTMLGEPEEIVEGTVGGAAVMPTEEEMLSILSRKYLFVPKVLKPETNTSTTPSSGGGDVGARPKVQPLMSLATHPPPSFNFSPAPHQYVPTAIKVPKIPLFSGDTPTPKSEISFYEWRHEVRCIRNDPCYNPTHVIQAIRSSLRGTARRLVVSLGDSVSADSIINKLEVNFGEPALKGVTMKEFYNCCQRADESVTSFGCRLESILDQACESGLVSDINRSEMLCDRLWSGLYSSTLKNNTRHKLDSINDYDSLIKHIRQVEKELSLSAPSSKTSSSKSPHVSVQQQYPDFHTEISDLEQRLNTRISAIQSDVDMKFSAILQRLDSLSTDTPQANPSLFPHPLPDTSKPPPLFPQPQSQTRGANTSRRWRGGAKKSSRGEKQQPAVNPNF
jgi:hypothetical protein